MSKTIQTTNINKQYQELFDQIEIFQKEDRPVIIGIDGTAGSGKTSLARTLQKKYHAQVFHMDDFFLPLEMKTEERLSEPGGNVHYERFLTEVLEPLKQGKLINYRPYDCQLWEYSESIPISPKKINVIEGVYCFHPILKQFYDWKVFLKVDSKVQKERILKREGKEKLEIFLNRWIPLENKYFEAFEVEQFVDLIIDTSTE